LECGNNVNVMILSVSTRAFEKAEVTKILGSPLDECVAKRDVADSAGLRAADATIKTLIVWIPLAIGNFQASGR